jgi:AcrR family transcriptional regulator
MNPDDRKEQLLKAALTVAKTIGYRATTRLNVADQAKVSSALVPFHLGDVETMRKSILHAGCAEGHVKLIVEGVLDNDKVAIKAAHKYKDSIIKALFK